MENEAYKFGQPVVVNENLIGIVLYSHVAVGNDPRSRTYRILVDSCDCAYRIAHDSNSQRGNEQIKKYDFWTLIRETTQVMVLEVSTDKLKKLDSVELDTVELEALIADQSL